MEINYDKLAEIQINIVDNLICMQLDQDLFLQPADQAIIMANHIIDMANCIIKQEAKNGLRYIQ